MPKNLIFAFTLFQEVQAIIAGIILTSISGNISNLATGLYSGEKTAELLAKVYTDER